ncbi:NAD(P)-dependent oxidoreductase [Cognatishimia sp. MH4019]|uniref:NAD-dependent epimerase/dehydratase family protein n=1 Tax=Cognatishimia sp. MH4019 TaxID=2854030 RepID=UPI001CD530F9|nr:NAD(P)-dependent oxidoreductase [Cognatishimia sp. MH4019]
MANVLITGASGFIGSHLVRACLERGDRVTALLRPQSGTARLADMLDRIHVKRCDLTDHDALLAILKEARADMIFHLGATTRYPHPMAAGDHDRARVDNLAPVQALVSACLDVPPLVLVRCGTIAEYGDISLPYREGAAESPVGVYGASMLAATRYLERVQPELGFPVRTARLALTYGPRQNADFLIPQLLDACLAGKALTVERPDDRRDLIFVDDVVSSLLILAERADAAEAVTNIGSGHAPTVHEVAQMIIALTDADPTLLKLGEPDGGPRELRLNVARAARTLDWKAKVPLDEGLRRTLEWMRSNSNATGAPVFQMQDAAP